MTAFEKIHIDHLTNRVDHYASLADIQSARKKEITGRVILIENDNRAKWVRIEFYCLENKIYSHEKWIGVNPDDNTFKEAIRTVEVEFLEELVALVLDTIARKDDLSKAVINAVITRHQESILA